MPPKRAQQSLRAEVAKRSRVDAVDESVQLQADNAATSKRFRAAIDESTEEFLCPITQSLPLDPVLAEDGMVYERSAIEHWLAQHKRSPNTNQPMGSKLTPARAVRNMIERMVRSGALPEEKTADWRKRICDQERVAELRRCAEDGNSEAAVQLAAAYHYGWHGLTVDDSKALPLARQAADEGTASGISLLASIYFRPTAHRNDALALRWSAAAAALGELNGMINLAQLYDSGRAGLPADKQEAFKLRLRACELFPQSVKSVSLFRLGEAYASGEFIPTDMDKAAEWMRRAVASAEPVAFAQKARAWLLARGLAL